jgi:hypothetical protein
VKNSNYFIHTIKIDISLYNEKWLYDVSAVSGQQSNMLLDDCAMVADII